MSSAPSPVTPLFPGGVQPLGGREFPHPHRVQFYDDEAFLYRVVGDYLGQGLLAGDSAVVIATAEHRAAFCRRLADLGLDVADAGRRGQLVLLDAEQTLGQFMREGQPDPLRFRAVVGQVLDQIAALRPGAPVRAYGEMVDLLWRVGNPSAALALEELWNDLGQQRDFDLLCAYLMSNFSQGGDSAGFEGICHAHSHVTPTESCGEITGPGTLLRRVSLLEQKARALEVEVARGKQLEASLRDALVEREQIAESLQRREQELRQHNDELSRTVRFSETFVGILGHDLRNPLSGITTAASLLLRRSDNEKVRTPSLRILNSGQRMARMIDQLLDFTRIRLGQGLPLQLRPVDLGAVCRQALDDIEGCEGDPDRSGFSLQAAGNLVGEWDADRLCQLVGNLVGNAIAHGQPGAPVRLSLDGRDPGQVALEVHNQGAIPADVLRVIFEPLRGAADRKQAHSSGLGLGLYISQQIAMAHQARIEVTSSDEIGTRFIISLPRTAGRPESAFAS